jgi:hypothetical protein
MSEADEFRLYAEETMDWVKNCTDPKEKMVLISLANTWLHAAGRSDTPVVVKGPPPERAA